MKKQRYSLSIHITNLFLIVTLFIGGVLIGISYYYGEQILTQSAKELSYENSSKLESTFRQNASPILTSLDFISLHTAIRQRQAPLADLHLFKTVQLSFQRNPNLAALFYANKHGDLTVFRQMRSQQDRTYFNAPPRTDIMLHYTQVDGKNQYFFFDHNLLMIGSRQGDENQFDPRTRSWFTDAQNDGQIRLTQPYQFYFLNTSGVTFSRRSQDGESVIGADLTLRSMSEQISAIAHSDHSRLLLMDSQFRLIAHHNAKLDTEQDNFDQALEASLFQPILHRSTKEPIYETAKLDGIKWSITLAPVALNDNVNLLLAEAMPQTSLLGGLIDMRNTQLATAVVMLLASFVFVWWVAKRLTQPLLTLVDLTSSIARFDFKKTRYPKSLIREVNDLAQSIQLMEHTLHDLLRLLRETASNDDFNSLAKTVAHQSYLVTKAETILLFTYSSTQQTFNIVANHAIIPFKIDLKELLTSTAWLMTKLKQGEVVHLQREENALKKFRDKVYNSDLYLFPLLNRQKNLVGVLLLGYERKLTKQQSDKHAFMRELLSFAEIAKENIDRIKQQKDIFNSFIELIASAIDTKSPFTGNHCQRIPILTEKITQVAEQDTQYYPDFSMTPSEWEELSLAAWLHDCGKVTTPEYVIDKATKLETIYDRIHEVRMRFELLKVQAESDYWRQVAEGGDASMLKKELHSLQTTLDEEFAFVAASNIGGEEMDKNALAKLEVIAKRQWKRTIDDQLGISWLEQQRAGKPQSLPVMEPLLSDKHSHLIEWDYQRLEDQEGEHFNLKPGQYKYNRGELHNLSIRRGTLNDEERFIINDHIIQTYRMLKRLPFPEHLTKVPEIASNHHERMDGKGYPRGLHEEQLSIPARAMAIADVFEALTSSDRPYKKAKTLAEALNIMTDMATSGHIDPKLYMLFLQNKIDQQYAQLYLAAAQYVTVDREAHIQRVKNYLRQQF